MKQKEMKMEIVVTLSEESVNEIANAIGFQILDIMEQLLKPIYDDVKEIKSDIKDVESNTDWILSELQSDEEDIKFE